MRVETGRETMASLQAECRVLRIPQFRFICAPGQRSSSPLFPLREEGIKEHGPITVHAADFPTHSFGTPSPKKGNRLRSGVAACLRPRLLLQTRPSNNLGPNRTTQPLIVPCLLRAPRPRYKPRSRPRLPQAHPLHLRPPSPANPPCGGSLSPATALDSQFSVFAPSPHLKHDGH